MLKTSLKIIGCSILLITSCIEKHEKVLETFPDGKPKMVARYANDTAKIPVEEIRYYENGNAEITGNFNAKGERHGVWMYFFPSGKIWSEHSYNNGIKEGSSKVYYENGKVRYSGQFKNGEQYGKWSFSDSTGKVVEVKEF